MSNRKKKKEINGMVKEDGMMMNDDDPTFFSLNKTKFEFEFEFEWQVVVGGGGVDVFPESEWGKKKKNNVDDRTRTCAGRPHMISNQTP
jgi:hypothetical protein